MDSQLCIRPGMDLLPESRALSEIVCRSGSCTVSRDVAVNIVDRIRSWKRLMCFEERSPREIVFNDRAMEMFTELLLGSAGVMWSY